MGATRWDAPRTAVSFVSAGPGAADLITLRGLQRYQSAAVLLFDALTDLALPAWPPPP